MVEIRKELFIRGVKSEFSDHPFQILFGGGLFDKSGGECRLSLDAATCDRYQIPMSLDLVKRIITCTLQSRELPLRLIEKALHGEERDLTDLRRLIGDNGLGIELLEKKETIRPRQDDILNAIPLLSKYSEIFRLLVLRSFGGEYSAGRNFLPPPPFYYLFLELTEEEYEACKALSVYSIFKVDLQLKEK